MSSPKAYQSSTSHGQGTGAAATAYAMIRDRILNMNLAESAFLTEMGVAGELGISRTPVREAFLQLAAENLLQLLPKKGAFVPPIHHREAVDVMELRELIETFSVERLLSREEQIEQTLIASLNEQEQCLDNDNGSAFIAADRGFHLAIVRGSGNATMAGVYEHLRDRQLRMGVRAVAGTPKRRENVMAEHRSILDGIVQCDVGAAQTAVRVHLRNTLEALSRQW